ncbi:MAG: CehA/McbA family metallohydrolase [Anaerolineales bacterium]|nr:CehA/McbA family metallohydrolase [Anaerolineales bacterium]
MSELSLSKVYNPNAGWYKGDFHAHTDCSDGRYSAVEVIQLSLAQGLDFFAITDHNTINSFDQFGDDPAMLVIPGIEVTLDMGHCNIFGMEGNPASAWQHWMEGICGDQIWVPLSDGRTTTSLLREIAACGLFTSINHPFLNPWEWRDADTELNNVQFIEVWNDHLWPDNRQATPMALDFWTRTLNAGMRLTAIGGSDFHFLPGDQPEWPGEYMGMPSTWVYAEELSGKAVLDGLRQHRAFISIGPKLIFEAKCADEIVGIGGSLPLAESEIEIFARVEALEGEGCLRLIQNGTNFENFPVRGEEAQFKTRVHLDGRENQWFRLEACNRKGDLLAFTNPIFIGPEPQLVSGKFGDYC